MKLVVGLGNPGKQYERTRHNAGFIVIDRMVTDCGLRTAIDKKNKAELVKDKIEGKRVILAKPSIYMNNSGEAVKALLSFYKLTPTDLIVIHDDKDIPLGEYRVHQGRGAAGHNGVQSIIEQLGTKDFTRLRVGIAQSPNQPPTDTANFVLGKLTREEQKTLRDVIVRVIQEINRLIAG